MMQRGQPCSLKPAAGFNAELMKVYNSETPKTKETVIILEGKDRELLVQALQAAATVNPSWRLLRKMVDQVEREIAY